MKVDTSVDPLVVAACHLVSIRDYVIITSKKMFACNLWSSVVSPSKTSPLESGSCQEEGQRQLD